MTPEARLIVRFLDSFDRYVDTQERIAAAMERQLRPAFGGPSPVADPRDVAIVVALSSVLGADDLTFSASEVINHARVDHDLDVALSAAGARDSRKLGCLLRRLEGRPIQGLAIRRDGEAWRLDRTSPT